MIFNESLEKEKECYKRFNEIIFVSNSAKDGFKKLFGDDFNNPQVKYNTIIAGDVIKKSQEYES